LRPTDVLAEAFLNGYARMLAVFHKRVPTQRLQVDESMPDKFVLQLDVSGGYRIRIPTWKLGRSVFGRKVKLPDWANIPLPR
jgi:hypothetical protein